MMMIQTASVLILMILLAGTNARIKEGEWSITNQDGDHRLLYLYNDGILECSKWGSFWRRKGCCPMPKRQFGGTCKNCHRTYERIKTTRCYIVECPLSHVLDNVNNANDNGSRVVYLDGLQMSTRLPKTSRRQYKSEAQNGREWRFAKISDLRSFQIQLQRLETKVTNGKQFIKDANQKA